MSFRDIKYGNYLQQVADAKAYENPQDFRRGYISAIADIKQFSIADARRLAKAIFSRSGVRNTWEKLPVGVQEKYVNDAIYIARSMGYDVDAIKVS